MLLSIGNAITKPWACSLKKEANSSTFIAKKVQLSVRVSLGLFGVDFTDKEKDRVKASI